MDNCRSSGRNLFIWMVDHTTVFICHFASYHFDQLFISAGLPSMRHRELLRRKFHNLLAYICQFHLRFFASTHEIQYLELRFSRTIRYISIVAWIVYVMLYMPIVLYLPSLAFAEGSYSKLIIHFNWLRNFLKKKSVSSHWTQYSHCEYNCLLLLCNLHVAGKCLMIPSSNLRQINFGFLSKREE